MKTILIGIANGILLAFSLFAINHLMRAFLNSPNSVVADFYLFSMGAVAFIVVFCAVKLNYRGKDD